MNSKIIFLLCACTIGIIGSNYGMDSNFTKPKRVNSMPLIGAHLAPTLPEETEKELLRLRQCHKITHHKANCSCFYACFQGLNKILKILELSAKIRAIE